MQYIYISLIGPRMTRPTKHPHSPGLASHHPLPATRPSCTARAEKTKKLPALTPSTKRSLSLACCILRSCDLPAFCHNSGG